MAKADYICCDRCGDKLIYDAYNAVLDELEFRLMGDTYEEDVLDILCEKCSGVGGILIRRSAI